MARKVVILSSFLLTFLITVLNSYEPAASFERGMANPSNQWQLVWFDEFNYRGLPNPLKWTYEEGFVRNNEAQYYTRARRQNVWVENGMLVIEARKEKYQNAKYTSASVTTNKRASWRYGRIEVKAKLPTGQGMWPAIWMLGTNYPEVEWPLCGEIDIMENVGYDPNVIHAHVYTQAFNYMTRNVKGSSIVIPLPHTEFHIYAMEWFKDRIDFFVDDRKYFTFKNTGNGIDEWPFDGEHYLILNAAIGGGWGGKKGIDDRIFPQKYYIDYVRVYQQTN
ncbi:glycoside hydrolase family 16 protein [Iningainema tapete]|uniref:Glycoside hydrolase family 16 protein n=1 Tax=Iningainema tapete BLCC-T55 TaxID=2748662 RepID=A0A8J6XE38_9CYAN|nr:glycoside hydrolase family 16 protein [Iningainema tapete]MBD2774605.1 glycoside hydrolase family 16 protein [Iningainema tapete BLCC-T55]